MAGAKKGEKGSQKVNIYTEKAITKEQIQENPKFMHILVFKSEADWSYAMQMKQHAANLSGKQQIATNSSLVGKRVNPNRLRVHFLRRFARAA